MKKGETSCMNCIKNHLSLFRSLNDRELELLNEKRTQISYQRGETIYKEGIFPYGLLCLSKGKVKIIKCNSGGKELIIELKKPLDLIGFTELLEHKRYETKAVAIEDSIVCVIDKEDFFKVLERNTAFALQINSYLASELSRMQHKILSLTQKYLDARLAESLLEFYNLYGVDPIDGITINTILRRDDLAALSGMTSSNVSRTLTDFEKKGIISIKGRRIKILDKKRLEDISG